MATENGQGTRLGNMYCFLATAQTGNGSGQSIPHLLGRIPDLVIVMVDDSVTATWTLGTQTDTNVVVTVTNAKTYSVLALVF